MAEPGRVLSVDGAPGVHTVIVTVDADPAEMEPLREHAARGLELFGAYPGFLGGALHVSEDGARLVQYLRWASEPEYRACIDDPAWDDLPSTRAFLGAAAQGISRVDARSYRVTTIAGA